MWQLPLESTSNEVCRKGNWAGVTTIYFNSVHCWTRVVIGRIMAASPQCTCSHIPEHPAVSGQEEHRLQKQPPYSPDLALWGSSAQGSSRGPGVEGVRAIKRVVPTASQENPSSSEGWQGRRKSAFQRDGGVL